MDGDGQTVREPGALTHGAVALIAVNIIRLAMPRPKIYRGSRMDDADDCHDNGAMREHMMIDALRLAFHEAPIWIADGEAGRARGMRHGSPWRRSVLSLRLHRPQGIG